MVSGDLHNIPPGTRREHVSARRLFRMFSCPLTFADFVLNLDIGIAIRSGVHVRSEAGHGFMFVNGLLFQPINYVLEGPTPRAAM